MSATVTSAPTSTRRSLGPLTTTFTPPDECLVFGVNGDNTTIYGLENAQLCSSSWNYNASSCWPTVAPSVWASLSSSIYKNSGLHAFNGLGFYSPGLLCPQGYTQACTALGNGPLASGSSFPFQQFPPAPGETAIGCCPSYEKTCFHRVLKLISAQGYVMSFGPWESSDVQSENKLYFSLHRPLRRLGNNLCIRVFLGGPWSFDLRE